MFGPLVATLIPIAVMIVSYVLLDHVAAAYEDRSLPLLTAWAFEHRGLVVLMLLPAAVCGSLSMFIRRRFLLYGPYLLLLMAPLLFLVLAFGWMIVDIYAREIESAM